jgi:PAS domain S-box-containing protein
MRLADLLNEQQHAIEERWIERVRPLAPREGLTREDLVDSLPLFLTELSRALRHLDDASATSMLSERSPIAEAHGRQRHGLGYATEAVAREYPLLHEVILSAAASAGVAVSAHESILLARCMGTATAEALSRFTSASEQALRQSAGNARLQHAFSKEQLHRVQAAEQQARESEARLSAILASLEEGVSLHDASGTVLFANAAAARLTGLSLEQVQGRTPMDPRWRAVREDGSDYPGDEHPPMRALRTGQPVVGDVLGIHRPDGRLVWLSVNAQPLLGGDGGPALGAVSSFSDITARKRREAHLALLAEVSEDFARLVTPDDIMQTVGAKLGAYLKLTNLSLVEVDDACGKLTVDYSWGRADTPSLVRTYRLEEYLSKEVRNASRAGVTVVVRDTQTDPRTDARAYAALEIGAFVTVPFHVGGEWKAWVTVCDVGPRDWRKDEIELLQELSNRLFPRLERARAEEALRRSEERYRSLFESMAEGFCILQLVFDEAERPVDCRYTEVNPAFERQTGMRGALGKTIRELVPNIEPFWFDIYGKVALTGEPTRFEDHAASMSRWFNVHAFPIGAPEEHKVAVLFSDITQRKRAEAAADAERKKLHDIFEQAPVIIAIVEGREYTFSFANPAYRALIGGLDVAGKSLREVLPDLEGEGIRALLDGVTTTGVPYVGREVPMTLFHDGLSEEKFFDFVYQPMRDEEGRVHGVLGCGYEVTGLVRARQEAEALAAQREAILQAFPEPVYFADATGIARANAAGLAMLGFASMEELDRSKGMLHERARMRRLDTGEFVRPEEDLLVRALQGHTGFLDCIMRDASTGADRVMRSAAAPVRLGEQVVGAVAFSTDITERMLAEQALRERADFEEKLIGIVGHDLRQPLQTIAMSTGLLARRPGLDERALGDLQRITAAAARMQRMLYDILDFTRARLGGTIPLARVQCDVAQLAREAIEEVEMVHPGRRVVVAVECSGEGRWDPDRLRQVFDNLLTNALAYSPAGTPVQLAVDGQMPNEVHVRVHNAGAPIPAALLPVLFQPLTRGTGTGRVERSVGLGLFIVRHIVEAHGGRVEVASSEPEGTTFSVHLPRG